MSRTPKRQLTDEQMLLLVQDFKGFLRVGHVLHEEWEALDPQAKACLTKAAEELEAERMLNLIRGLSDPDEALRLTAPLDGGTTFVEAQLGKVVRNFLHKRAQRA